MHEESDPLQSLLGDAGRGLTAANRAWVEDLYASWVESPSSVPASWQAVFERIRDPEVQQREHVLGPSPSERSIFGGAVAAQAADEAARVRKQSAVLQLISAYRRSGHLVADLDPLGLRRPAPRPELTLGYWGLDDHDLDTTFHVGRLAGPRHATLREILERCRETYCGSVGSEFMYIRDEERRRWVERRIEESGSRIQLDRPTALRVLEKLMGADRFEHFIHTKYLGAKRFSVEGGEAVIPLLDLLLGALADQGVKEAVLGMAHRGRLNVLANILGKAHRDIFEEFEDKFDRPDTLGGGDVKYHLGYSSDVRVHGGGRVHVSLAFNPSHLEFVAPVVQGQVRAKQDHFGDEERSAAVPIHIHGDAAFAGQGIATETLQLGGLDGYTTGGSIHIVINNQVGFTTPPSSSRSAEHCTDVVKLVLPPVFHVNADDLGAVAFVARLAAEYRQRFGMDVIIDLWCFRKYGHNESDEPAYTNPVMVRAIKARRSPLELFRVLAIEQGVLTAQDFDEAEARIRAHLDDQLQQARDAAKQAADEGAGTLGGLWKGLVRYDPAALDRSTQVPADKLRAYATRLAAVPEGFRVNRKLRRVLESRRAVGRGEGRIDWAMGEALAFASLLGERYDIRLSGQDSGRGTFSHRHAVLHDAQDDTLHVPLNDVAERQGFFEVLDSPLSEAAVLAFEYGYTLARPDVLVLWEAQFGDFANGAQVIIDQFVSSSEAKWNRCSGLVMLLPHGYEGQGPEHSSARLERFLQLSGEGNWRVMNLTTPAQIFHALRGQLHRNYRKPLVVMTPKSLLRHPRAVSSLEDLAGGWFEPVIGDPQADPARVERVILCSGKVYYDLLEAREAAGEDRAAVVRIEQLYPFPDEEVALAVAPFAGANELVWCQEEPENMGAWWYLQSRLRGSSALPVRYAGRSASASPATGSKHLHTIEQTALLRDALRLDQRAADRASA